MSHFRHFITILLSLTTIRAQVPFENCQYAIDECPNQQIRFWLYRNSTESQSLLLNVTRLNRNDFTPKLPLKIIIHGFNGSRNSPVNADIRPVLLQTQSVYVISVDYSELTHIPCYSPWSLYNAPIVAKCLAQLLDELIDSNITTISDMHLIGFSLGAQIAGLTANYVKHNLSRITGLDPARPGFVSYNLADKLDETDANFVDVIHTDPFFFSLLSPMGHADFYPNLKNVMQPGCSYEDGGRFRNCNHFRASQYYAESIVSKRGFWSHNCGHWFKYLLDMCMEYTSMPITQMGYWVHASASGSYFLTTNSASPFAQGAPVEFEFEGADNSTWS